MSGIRIYLGKRDGKPVYRLGTQREAESAAHSLLCSTGQDTSYRNMLAVIESWKEPGGEWRGLDAGKGDAGNGVIGAIGDAGASVSSVGIVMLAVLFFVAYMMIRRK